MTGEEWANEKAKYTDDDRRRAMRAIMQAGKDLAALAKRMAPELKAIGQQLRDALEDITADKKPEGKE